MSASISIPEPLAFRPITSEQATPGLAQTKKKELTTKQRKFVNFYLSGDNAYKAAIKAGYSEYTANIASIVKA